VPRPFTSIEATAIRETRLNPLLAATFRAFRQAQLRWCLLRRPANLEAPHGDVDLLIDRADHQDACRILKGLGYVQLAGWGYGSASFFLGYHPETDHWIWLHLVSELAFGPYYLLRTRAEAGCMARRRQQGTLAELAPDDAFWVVLLHCLLDKGAVPPRHRSGLRKLVPLARADSPLALYASGICPVHWSAHRLIESVEGEQWTRLERLAPRLVNTAMGAPIAIRQRWALAGLRLTAQSLNALRPIMWRRYIGPRRRRRRSRSQPGSLRP
jgi:hypothetical protein